MNSPSPSQRYSAPQRSSAPAIPLWFALLFTLQLPLFSLSLAARELLPETQPWDLTRLSQAPEAEWGATEGLVQEVYYKGEPLRGKPTRVFAYVGRPEGEGPFPGIVLVHGGGGHAFSQWAQHWAQRGYVAIAMDTAGNGPGKKRLEDGGPGQDDAIKFRDFKAGEIRDMWTYHAVADVVLAHSLLLSLPEVDAGRTGLTGISWGGYLTCITAGVDPRFKAAVPVYGCGFLHDNSVWNDNGSLARMDAAARRLWIRNFDPGQHVGRAACPMLFLNGTNDFAYPLDSYRKTIEQVKPELATVAIHHQLPHGHIWTFEIVDAFIDSVLGDAPQLTRLGDLHISGSEAWTPVTTATPVASAELWYSADSGKWQTRTWKSIPAKVAEGEIRAELPADRPITFFLQAVDTRGLRTSSTHAHLEQPGVPTNHALVPTPRLERDFYDWYRRHAEVLRLKDEVDPEVVLIGDSITHMWGGVPSAQGRAKGADSWQKLFGDRALNLGFGWDRTQNVLWRIDHGELDGLQPKTVVVHIGTNNLAGTKNHVAGTPEQIAAGIRAVCERVRHKLPEAQLVLMEVFPRGEKSDHPMRAPIAEINARLPAIAEELGAELVSLRDALLDEDGIYSKELASDFLHPTARGYQIWADALRPFLE